VGKLEVREGIPDKVRQEILWDYVDMPADCRYCQSWATEIDHVMPVSRGGTNARDNLAAACWRCNRQKSDMTVAEWRAWRERRGYCWPPGHWEGCWTPSQIAAGKLDPELDAKFLKLYVEEFDLGESGLTGFQRFLANESFSKWRGYVADREHDGLEHDLELEGRMYNQALRKALDDWRFVITCNRNEFR
jgi:hypothetical protein